MATINETKKLLAAADYCGKSTIVQGLHGIGKTQAMEQYAREAGLNYVPLILSLMAPEDLLGRPDDVSIAGMQTMIWSAPDWYSEIVNLAWPPSLETSALKFNDPGFEKFVNNSLDLKKTPEISRDELNKLYCTYGGLFPSTLHILRQDLVHYTKGKRSLLNLDEFNRAEPQVLRSSLQLIENKRLHNHILPKVCGQETVIVACINPASDGYQVDTLDPALLDRFLFIDVTVSPSEWIEWAKQANLPSVVTDFIAENHDKLHFVPEDGTKGTSPRSWEAFANYLDNIEQAGPDAYSTYATGVLGSSTAARFILFHQSYANNVNIKTITKDLKKIIKPYVTDTLEDVPKVDLQELADEFTLIEKVNTLHMEDFASALADNAHQKSVKDRMAALVFLYALPLEVLSSFIQKFKRSDLAAFKALVETDRAFNDKALIKKIVVINNK